MHTKSKQAAVVFYPENRRQEIDYLSILHSCNNVELFVELFTTSSVFLYFGNSYTNIKTLYVQMYKCRTLKLVPDLNYYLSSLPKGFVPGS